LLFEGFSDTSNGMKFYKHLAVTAGITNRTRRLLPDIQEYKHNVNQSLTGSVLWGGNMDNDEERRASSVSL
jgi:hypothetical protein